MASRSAAKRLRQADRSRARNRWRKRTIHDAVREYDEAILHASVEEAEKQLQHLYKLLDLTAAKGTIHKNTAARRKSRLATRLEKKKAGTH